MATPRPFTDEQARTLVNLRQRYETWRDAEQAWRALPYDLRRKRVGDYEYLYEIRDRSGNGTSLGRWDADKARRFEAYRADKAALKQRLDSTRAAVDEGARLARALRVPMLASAGGPILREADCRGLLDGQLLVVGTNALLAYGYEAVAGLGLNDETDDFDFAWAGTEQAEGAPVWDMLKAVDATFTVNTERTFQARNSVAYEVELLIAPSRAATLGSLDKPHPIPLPEQEWLLLGWPVDQVVVCRDATAARIVAPDPRWFALHKLWLSVQPKRNPFKRRKDREQGLGVLDAVIKAMPQYPLDAAFEAEIPPELEAAWAEWQGRGRPPASAPRTPPA
jgi:hypothetical protein